MSDNSVLLLVSVILLIFMLTMGQVTKARIYNILALGSIMFITIQFKDYTSIVIMMIGLFLYQLYFIIKE